MNISISGRSTEWEDDEGLARIEINGIVCKTTSSTIEKLCSLVKEITNETCIHPEDSSSITKLNIRHLRDSKGNDVIPQGVASFQIESGKAVAKPSLGHGCAEYIWRWRQKKPAPPFHTKKYMSWSVLGAFIGIALLGLLNTFATEDTDLLFISSSFGAQAVLLFAAPHSTLAQPWNSIVGNGLSAFVGILVHWILGNIAPRWLLMALSVSLSTLAMHVSKSMHPPGGATALIASCQKGRVKELGVLFILFPTVFGSILHILVAMILNNCIEDKERNYPLFWEPFKCLGYHGNSTDEAVQSENS